jgi:hypothetical protein
VSCEPYSTIVGAGVICAEQPQHIHHIFPFISELSVKIIFLVQLYFPESLGLKLLVVKCASIPKAHNPIAWC